MAMANCLMLLTCVRKSGSSLSEPGRLFYCKTCNKPFRSFQALGGHRAWHKRPKLNDCPHQVSPAKAKTHERSIRGVEFVTEQALGGHMRRRRDHVARKRVHPAVKKREWYERVIVGSEFDAV